MTIFLLHFQCNKNQFHPNKFGNLNFKNYGRMPSVIDLFLENNDKRRSIKDIV